jgi:hypothetical protein
MVSEQIINITTKLFYFFVPEVLTWVLLDKKGNRFSFRFKRVEGHPQLRPFAKTWIVAITIILITLFSGDLFVMIFGTKINDYLLSFGSKVGLLTVALFGFTFLWTYNYLLEKKWDKISWGVSAIIIILIFLLFYN